MPGKGIKVEFPQGCPLPMKIVGVILGGAFAVAFVAVSFGASGWLIDATGYFLALNFVVASALLRHYELVGRVHFRGRDDELLTFSRRIPLKLKALRALFFLIVVVMVAFAIAPIAGQTAQRGIIGCIIALFMTAIAYALADN